MIEVKTVEELRLGVDAPVGVSARSNETSPKVMFFSPIPSRTENTKIVSNPAARPRQQMGRMLGTCPRPSSLRAPWQRFSPLWGGMACGAGTDTATRTRNRWAYIWPVVAL